MALGGGRGKRCSSRFIFSQFSLALRDLRLSHLRHRCPTSQWYRTRDLEFPVMP